MRGARAGVVATALLAVASASLPASGAILGRFRAAPRALLYVADPYVNVVTIYDANVPNGTPLGQISQGLDGPVALAVDSRSQLYVGNVYNNTVTVYPPGQLTPSLMYSSGIDGPAAIAVHTSGTVFVLDFTGNNSASVTVFPPYSTTPEASLYDPNVVVANALAVDARLNAYLPYYGTAGTDRIDEFRWPSTTPIDLGISQGTAQQTRGIALDKSGNLVVGAGGLIGVYPPGATTPSGTFGPGAVSSVYGLAFNRAGTRLYASDNGNARVAVFSYPSGTLLYTIPSSSGSAFGIALSPREPLPVRPQH